jgi:hypothetical protein
MLPFRSTYMLPFVHVLLESSHFMWAFSQSALVVGVLSAANPVGANATVRPKATMIETSFFIGVLS